MKKILFCVLLLAIAGACKRDFLNTKPLDKVSSTDAWKDGALAESFITGIYAGLGQGGFDEQMLAVLSDEAVFTHPGRGINIVNEGTLNPSNIGWVNVNYRWGKDASNNDMYAKIRQANLALENLRIATFEDKTLNDRLQGEAHFMRAFFYQQLIRYYGGVPIIDRSYGLGEDYSVTRNTWEECVNFVLRECDSAILLLKGKTVALGRASDLAAMALKSRMLLYTASDLHDMPTARSKSAVISGYAKPELLGYTGGDRIARWTAAKNAAKALMDANPLKGYKLNLTAPVSAADGKRNYVSLAMGGGSKSADVDKSAESEILFGRYWTINKDESSGMYVGLTNGPNGYHNWAGNTPVQLLVDDYEMMDGTQFSWSNPTQKAQPYANRDPRFYASILYDGADWKPRDKISGNVDPANQIQTGKYDQGGGVFLPGLDTRSSSIENWNGSWTGYYVRKFTDPDPDLVDNTTRQTIPWPFFRYTEVVMNYIEACIELGEESEARTWLNRIRFRAGMPAVTETGAALKERYRNERRIELAYEDQRYHDCRRWMIAPATLGRKLVYIDVVARLKAGASFAAPYKHDETKYNYTYTPLEVNSQEDRKWDDKMYYRPIPQDEMNTNLKLIQNPGYN
ncbi:carbohydrate-binding protein SusD [Niastella yeongjuensis]|uniref:Carbohydrate-binding protein SusD n=1 Tax=Niastella yeongjuensis TaxID=354355 RepID=A0A1V9EEP2_9BACT|nr:RagB/SusD family nutrient uptake outer membrane protein [Niastella yeongjuensis]OQP44617.1 carbohydrate-binding protein SusD [Niastella yeongjuensis]SEO81216.1 Starch-binding associating with outer membrane [Niastella yeongjuensis]